MPLVDPVTMAFFPRSSRGSVSPRRLASSWAIVFPKTGCGVCGAISASAAIVDDGGLEISVKDTGVGISADDLKRVMEPFQQAEQDLSRRYGGVGLGLSLARNLTELHDGTIYLESEQGAWTIVRVHLPADRVRDYPEQGQVHQVTQTAH